MQFDLNAHIIFKKGSVQIDYSLFEHNMVEMIFTNFICLKDKPKQKGVDVIIGIWYINLLERMMLYGEKNRN